MDNDKYYVAYRDYDLLIDRPITNVKIYFIDFKFYLDCKALWDTGTTHTLIGEHIVRNNNLKSTAVREVLQPGNKKPKTKGVYNIHLFLSNELCVKDIKAPSIEIKDADILIGMDIIKWGNLSIENVDNKTVLTFLYPKNKIIR